MKRPLVSVIVPTYNSQSTLGTCLKSIIDQSYRLVELTIVDNHSTDQTKAIAQKYTTQVLTKGPERSAQRNYGVRQARGDYVLIIDSDMELAPNVIKACVHLTQTNPKIKAVVIPEESYGVGFWAQCKKLERSFYVDVDWMQAARFFDKKIFQNVGGYDEALVSGEDWDLSQRVEKIAAVEQIGEFILHNEGRVSLTKTIKKKYYYAKQFANYTTKLEHRDKQAQQTSLVARYKLFLTQPKKLWRHPLVGLGMLFMKTCEFVFGGFGYLLGRRKL